MKENKEKIVISLPSDRCVRNILDTRIYKKLQEKYIIHIVSPLSNIKDFCIKYGGENVHFHDVPQIKGLKNKLLAVLEICRYYGYIYRFKNVLTTYWNGEFKYCTDIENKKFKKRNIFQFYTFLILSILEKYLNLRKFIMNILGDWVFRNFYLDNFFRIEKPDFFIFV